MAAKNKTTSKEAASAASKVLADGRTGKDSKTAGGSALAQANKTTAKSTGKKAAAKASDVLQSSETGKNSKKAAGSALAQKKGGKK